MATEKCNHGTAMEAHLCEEAERLRAALSAAKEEIAKLAAFKAYVHKRLDDAGVPVDPDSPHKAEGCRIGGRLDHVFAEFERLKREADDSREEYVRLLQEKARASLAAVRAEEDADRWRQSASGDALHTRDLQSALASAQKRCESLESALHWVADWFLDDGFCDEDTGEGTPDEDPRLAPMNCIRAALSGSSAEPEPPLTPREEESISIGMEQMRKGFVYRLVDGQFEADFEGCRNAALEEALGKGDAAAERWDKDETDHDTSWDAARAAIAALKSQPSPAPASGGHVCADGMWCSCAPAGDLDYLKKNNLTCILGEPHPRGSVSFHAHGPDQPCPAAPAIPEGSKDGTEDDWDLRKPCPKCGRWKMPGYGLMGGGIGAYVCCSGDACDWMVKKQDEDEPASTPKGAP